MIASTIRHGDLSIDLQADGSITITHTDTGQTIQLSVSEWGYLMQIAHLHGWPIVPVSMVKEAVDAVLRDHYGN